MEAARSLNNAAVRILLADDEDLFLDALEAILAADGRFEVVGQARNGREAVDLTRRLDPDVVLMDISMPIMDGIEATREIRRQHPGACVLMLTGSSSTHDVDSARRAGAAAYVTKDRIAVDLLDAVLEIAAR